MTLQEIWMATTAVIQIRTRASESPYLLVDAVEVEE